MKAHKPICATCRDTRELKASSTAVIRGVKRTVIRRVVCPCSIFIDTAKLHIQRSTR